MNKSKKIVFFSGVPINDAATLYRTGLLAEKLQETGYKIIFTSVSANFQGLQREKISGLSVLFIGQSHYYARRPFSDRRRLGFIKILFANLKTCFRFAKTLRKEKPDKVLVVTTMPVSLMAGFVAKILGFKTFIDIEDLSSGQMEAAGYPDFFVTAYESFEKLGLRIFDRVAVCSHFLAERYPGSVIIPNMIEIGKWRRTRAFDRTKELTKIVFVGQMGLYHGQMEVLKTLTPLLKKKPNLKLIFAGGGEMLEGLRFKIKDLKLGRQIILTGQLPQEEVAKILDTADMGVLPLWDRPVHQARHPLKLLEYLAAGLVVITNRVGEATKIIKNGENGILCPAGDINCLGKKVEEIMVNPDTAGRISQKAQLTAQEFSMEKILTRWSAFLRVTL